MHQILVLFVGVRTAFCLVIVDRRIQDCRASFGVCSFDFPSHSNQLHQPERHKQKESRSAVFGIFGVVAKGEKRKNLGQCVRTRSLTSRECAECLHSLSCSPSSSPKQSLWQLPWAQHSFRTVQYLIIIHPNGHSDTTVRLHYSSPMTLLTSGDSSPHYFDGIRFILFPWPIEGNISGNKSGHSGPVGQL